MKDLSYGIYSVDTQADLTKESTWIVNGVNILGSAGTQVLCLENSKVYELESDDFTQAENWEEVEPEETLVGEEVTITPTISKQIITPSTGKNAITKATVNAVTSDIDANIVEGNIKKDVTILGITGTYEGGAQLNDLVVGNKYRRVLFLQGGTEVADSTFTSYVDTITGEIESAPKTVAGVLTATDSGFNISAEFEYDSGNSLIIKYKNSTTEIGRVSIDPTHSSSTYCHIEYDAGYGPAGISLDLQSGAGYLVPTSSDDAAYRYVAIKVLQAFDSDIVS